MHPLTRIRMSAPPTVNSIAKSATGFFDPRKSFRKQKKKWKKMQRQKRREQIKYFTAKSKVEVLDDAFKHTVG